MLIILLRGVDGMKIIVFSLNQQKYALPITDVKHIERVHDVTSIPMSPEHVLGIAEIRNEVFGVIDLRSRLGVPSVEFTDDTRFILVKRVENEKEVLKAALVVDSADNVMDINEEDIQPFKMGNLSEEKTISGLIQIKDEIIVLLKVDPLISNERILEEQLVS